MEGASTIDIFATKGIEYLLVIGFLVALVLFWRFLNPATAPRLQSKNVGESPSSPRGWFDVALNLFYHQGHTWAWPESDDVAIIGIDDFTQKLLGTPRRILFPDQGMRLSQGEPGWSFVIDSKSIELLSPLDGKVIEINEEVRKNPELLNEDPYGKGWLLKVQTSRLKPALKNLLTGGLAKTWMEHSAEVVRGKMSGEIGVVAQDGGTVVRGFARNISPDKWDELVSELLLTK